MSRGVCRACLFLGLDNLDTPPPPPHSLFAGPQFVEGGEKLLLKAFFCYSSVHSSLYPFSRPCCLPPCLSVCLPNHMSEWFKWLQVNSSPLIPRTGHPVRGVLLIVSPSLAILNVIPFLRLRSFTLHGLVSSLQPMDRNRKELSHSHDLLLMRWLTTG